MFQLVCLSVFALAMMDCTTQFGSINNAEYMSSDLTNTLSYNGTCLECMCYAFISNTSSDYSGLNCYKNNQTCLLFTNYLSRSMLRININSTFSFIQNLTDVPVIPAVAPTTTVTPSETTSSFQCHLPEWNSTGITFASGPGSNLNQINGVYGLFIVADTDILYIADSANTRVLKWLPGATSGTLIAGGQGLGDNATQLYNPTDVCVDRNENVYVADAYNFRIQYFSNGSLIGRTIAGAGTDSIPLGYMYGLGVDLNNNVYNSDADLSRVMKWPPNSTNGTQVAGTGVQGTSADQLSTPTAFYIDPITATLYIPNQTGHCITKWLAGSSNGTTVAGICGVPGANETLLTSPKCVTIDKYGNMYVVDGGDGGNGGRVIVFCPDSLVGKVIVSSGLGNPISIAVDTHLNIYVSDWTNVRLVKYPLL